MLESNGTYWRPVNKVGTLFQDAGSLATPLATYTGGTGAKVSLPAGNLVVPAGFLIPGSSRVSGTVRVRKRGTAAATNVYLLFGTANTSSDAAVGLVSPANSNNQDAELGCEVDIITSTLLTSSNRLTMWNTGTTAISSDISSNINISAAMYFSLAVGGHNAADSLDIIAYKITAEFE
jgi:hypothetical protein